MTEHHSQFVWRRSNRNLKQHRRCSRNEFPVVPDTAVERNAVRSKTEKRSPPISANQMQLERIAGLSAVGRPRSEVRCLKECDKRLMDSLDHREDERIL